MSFEGPGSSSMYVPHHFLLNSWVTDSALMSVGFLVGQESQISLVLRIIWYLNVEFKNVESGAPCLNYSFSWLVVGRRLPYVSQTSQMILMTKQFERYCSLAILSAWGRSLRQIFVFLLVSEMVLASYIYILWSVIF